MHMMVYTYTPEGRRIMREGEREEREREREGKRERERLTLPLPQVVADDDEPEEGEPEEEDNDVEELLDTLKEVTELFNEKNDNYLQLEKDFEVMKKVKREKERERE